MPQRARKPRPEPQEPTAAEQAVAPATPQELPREAVVPVTQAQKAVRSRTGPRAMFRAIARALTSSSHSLATAELIQRSQTSTKAAAGVDEIAQRIDSLRKSFWLSLAVLPFALGLHWWSEGTQTGKDLRVLAYSHLVTAIPTPTSSDPVYVVDIGRDFDLQEGHTDTRKLARLLQALKDLGPAAIAVDVDFGAFDPGDVFLAPNGERSDFPDFDASVEKVAADSKKPKVPVFLAVSRNLFGDETAWLPENLDHGYSNLVAAPVVPESKGDQVIVPESVHVAANRDIPSLGAALAAEYAKTNPIASARQPWWAQRIATDLAENVDPQLRKTFARDGKATLTLLNSGVVDALKASHIPVGDPADLSGGRGNQFLPPGGLAGKVLVVGTTLSDPGDRWYRSSSEAPEAGIYLHAAAAYTLIKEPLYELTPFADWTLTIGLTLAVLFATVLLRFRSIARKEADDHHKHHVRATALVVLSALLLGWGLVFLARVVWFGFVVTAIALLTHPSLDEGVHKALHRTGLVKVPHP